MPVFKLPDLFRHISGQSLACFRIVFGLTAALELWFLYPEIIDIIYIESDLHLKYHFFGWVKALPRTETYALVTVIGVSSLFVALGFMYRFSVSVLFFSWSYFILIDAIRYNNHWYLTSLIAGSLFFVPAHARFSLDALIFEKLRRVRIERWHLLLIQFYIVVAYIYGGIAKMNADWIRGEPISTWIRNEKFIMPVIGPFLDTGWAGYMYSWGGLLFDLFIVPLLVWKRTRVLALIAVTLFHLNNIFMFKIGNFPYFMLPATLVLLEPDWPERFYRWLTRKKKTVEGVSCPSWSDRSELRKKVITGVLATYFLIHALLPFRHFLFKGDPGWTEEGSRFAWRMMLRDKDAFGVFVVKDLDTGEEEIVETSKFVIDRYYATRIIRNPDHILQFAHYLERRFESQGKTNIAIYAEIKASLNFRKHQYLVDPHVDLLKEERKPFSHYDWIMPMNQPFR